MLQYPFFGVKTSIEGKVQIMDIKGGAHSTIALQGEILYVAIVIMVPFNESDWNAYSEY